MSQSRTVARNVLVTLITQIISWGLTFVVTLYVPGYLKAKGLGAITLAGSFATIFSLGIGLGTSTVLLKRIARNHSATGELLGAVLFIRISLGIVVIAMGWITAGLMGYSPELRTLIAIALISMALDQLNDAGNSALGGLERFPRQSASILAAKVTTSILSILLVVLKASWWTFIAAGIVGTSVSLFLNIIALWTYLKLVRLPSWRTMRSLVTAGAPFLTTSVFVAIYGQSDALLLSKLSTIAAIGWYGLAKRLGGTTLFIPVALTTTMLPVLTRTYHESHDAFTRALQRLMGLMVVCVVPFAAVLMLAPAQILFLLHYPPEFQPSIPVLVLMGGAIILWYLSQITSTAIIASDCQAALSRITGIAALASVPLCALCIHTAQRVLANGAIGAMASDTLLELYMVIAYIRTLPRGLISWRTLSLLCRATAASLPLVLLLHRVADRNHLYLALLGAGMYLPLCWLFRCLDPEDILLLKQLLKRNRRD